MLTVIGEVRVGDSDNDYGFDSDMRFFAPESCFGESLQNRRTDSRAGSATILVLIPILHHSSWSVRGLTGDPENR